MRRGLSSLIEPEADLTIVGETGSASEARVEILGADPDLVTLDLSLKQGSGLTLLEDLHAAQADLPVLVISTHDERLYAQRALEAGAQGYLMKTEADSKVIEAIRHVLDGGIYLSLEMTATVLSRRVGDPMSQEASLIDSLTDRELEAFMLMGQGYERREIAEALMLSPKTVDTYRDHLKEKLFVDTNAGLRRYAAIWMEQNNGVEP